MELHASHSLQPQQHYARAVRAHLPPELFQPVPRRLWLLPLHLAVIGAHVALLLAASPAWPVAVLTAIVAGHSWACLTFLAHEALHLSVVKSRLVQRLVAYVGFLPYGLSPTLWIAWHNQAHHAFTTKVGEDPDAFATLSFWQEGRILRFIESFTPGSGKLRSAIFLFVWFHVQSFMVTVLFAPLGGMYKRISWVVVLLETTAMYAFWGAVLVLVGPSDFLLVWFVPWLVANFVLMSHILTNHSFNAITEVNDPLANTLSVTNPRWVERMHLNFGYHVEHHLFPTMSAAHAPKVREVLVRLYGDRYLSMPWARAVKLLFQRPKLHLDDGTGVVDPRTMQAYQPLRPGDLSMPPMETRDGLAAEPA